MMHGQAVPCALPQQQGAGLTMLLLCVQVGGGIPPALAAARQLVRNELQAPPELVQELSRVAAAAGLPGADSWAQPNSNTWPSVWAAITEVRRSKVDMLACYGQTLYPQCRQRRPGLLYVFVRAAANACRAGCHDIEHDVRTASRTIDCVWVCLFVSSGVGQSVG